MMCGLELPLSALYSPVSDLRSPFSTLSYTSTTKGKTIGRRRVC